MPYDVRRIAGLVTYYGGKFYIRRKLYALMPSSAGVYVEPFVGGGSFFFGREVRYPVEVVNDIDPCLINLYRVVQSSSYKELKRLLTYTPYSRYHQRAAHEAYIEVVRRGKVIDDAVRFAYHTMCSFIFSWGGVGKAWSFGLEENRASAFRNRIEWLEYHHAYLQGVIILNKDVMEVIDQYDGRDTVFYFDPPYLNAHADYHHVMTVAQHEHFVDRLLRLKGRAIVSGYEHPVYQKLTEHGWKHIAYGHTIPRKDNATKYVTEHVWLNYDCDR